MFFKDFKPEKRIYNLFYQIKVCKRYAKAAYLRKLFNFFNKKRARRVLIFKTLISRGQHENIKLVASLSVKLRVGYFSPAVLRHILVVVGAF
jgi:hypothetical protein